MKPSRHHRLIRSVRIRAAAILGAVVLLAGIGVGAASVAQAAGPGPITGYQGLCLDDRSASTAQFNPIQVYTCNGSGAQQWTTASNGSVQVLGMCLDVAGAGTANGTKVDLYTCNGTGAQVWQPQSNGALLNPNSGKCLDEPAGAARAPRCRSGPAAAPPTRRGHFPAAAPAAGAAEASS